MLVCHIPCLKDLVDTVSGQAPVSVTGTPTFTEDHTHPFGRALVLPTSANFVANWTPNLHKAQQLSIGFWYKTSGKVEGDTTSKFIRALGFYTYGADGSRRNFRMELSSATGASYNFYNNDGFTTSGGVGGFSLVFGEWFHILHSFNLETGEVTRWLYRLSTNTTTKATLKVSIPQQTYLDDYFYLEKPATIADSCYSDVRIYNNLLTDMEQQHIIERKLLQYSFDSPLTGTFNTFADNSSMGNEPTSVTGVIINKDSKLGISCAEFTGSTTSFAAAPRTAMVTGPFTMNVWGYMDDWTKFSASNMRMISCTEGGGWNLEPGGSTLHLSFYDGGGSTYRTANMIAFADLTPGWHMFTTVFDGTNVKGYVDAVLKGTTTNFTGAPNGYVKYHASNSLMIGCEAAGGAGNGGSCFLGKLDNLEIYASALTPARLESKFKTRMMIDSGGVVKCSYITEQADAAENLFIDGSFESTPPTGTTSGLTHSLTDEEAYAGNRSLKVTGFGLTPQISTLPSGTGMGGTVTITHTARDDIYKITGTTGAAGGLSSFLFVPIPELAAGKNVTVTLTYVAGTATLSNATTGACYACPVVDCGSSATANTTTRHYSDCGSYPSATTKTIARTIAVTEADISGGMTGVRIWLHTRGSSSTYGATIVTFTNYQFKVRVQYDRGAKDLHFSLRDGAFLDWKHRYYCSLRYKATQACSQQMYVGAFEPFQAGGNLTITDKWTLRSSITNDAWRTKLSTASAGSKYIRLDVDLNRYDTETPTFYFDDFKIIDLTETYGSGLNCKSTATTGNKLSGFKFQTYYVTAVNGSTFSQTYTGLTLGTHDLQFIKTSNISYIRFGFNGSTADLCLNIPVTSWSNGTYNFRLNVTGYEPNSAGSSTVTPIGSFTIIPLFHGPEAKLFDQYTNASNLTVEMFDTGVIPTLAECNAKFNNATASTTLPVQFCNSKGCIANSKVSELGRPMRYIKVTGAGSSANSANHIVKLLVDTVDKGQLTIIDAFRGIYPTISGAGSYASTGSCPYYNVPASAVVDLGAVEMVAAVTLARYYGDSRVYYRTKIEGSIDNSTYFTIWDSHNTGVQGGTTNNNDYNTYTESAEGRTFTVEPDKIRLTKSGVLIAKRFEED